MDRDVSFASNLVFNESAVVTVRDSVLFFNVVVKCGVTVLGV